jgi:hypothetical protein
MKTESIARGMKTAITVVVLLASGAVHLALAEGAPKIQFDKTVYDFGVVTQAAQLSGTFAFTNAGDAVLKVEKPAPTCGCTVAGIKPDTLQPGEKGELTFTLNIPPNRIKLEKQIVVASNDPENPKVSLTIKADHQPLYEYAPMMLNVNVHQGATTNVVVEVKRTDGQKLVVSKITTKEGWITAKTEPAEPPSDAAARIVVNLKAGGDPRRVGDWVHVHTDNPDKPAFSVFANVRVTGDVVWEPDAIVWSINDPELVRQQRQEAMITRRLSVTAAVSEPKLAVSNLQSTLPGVGLEVVPGEAGKPCMIVAKLNDVPSQTVSGTLTFETNLTNQSKVQVPLIVSILKQ